MCSLTPGNSAGAVGVAEQRQQAKQDGGQAQNLGEPDTPYAGVEKEQGEADEQQGRGRVRGGAVNVTKTLGFALEHLVEQPLIRSAVPVELVAGEPRRGNRDDSGGEHQSDDAAAVRGRFGRQQPQGGPRQDQGRCRPARVHRRQTGDAASQRFNVKRPAGQRENADCTRGDAAELREGGEAFQTPGMVGH